MHRWFTFERAVVLALLGVIGLCVVLDGQESASPAGEQVAVELNSAEIARIVRRTEKLRGLKFRTPVKPLFVDRERAIELQEQANARDYSDAERKADEESLKLIGLLKPGDDIGKVIHSIEGEQVLGFYDPKTKRLVVIRGASAGRALLEITLSHELTHALEDQHFGLDIDGGLGDDGAAARSAIAEGSATEVMTNYAAEYLSAADLLAMSAAASSSTGLPKYVEDTLLFPYLEGQKFIETFKGQLEPGQGGSWGAVDSLIKARAGVSTEQILHPRSLALGDRPKQVRMPDVASISGEGWKRVDRSGVGELDLRELFKIVGGKSNNDAAAGWGGARFELWQRAGDDDCSSPCVERDIGVMRVVWDSEADRLQAGPAFRHSIEKGLRSKRIEARGDFGLWSSRGGTIAMIGRGSTTTIVFAPDATLAAKLLTAPEKPAAPATISASGR